MIELIVTLVLVGALLYIINNVIPIDDTIRKIINVVVILLVCVWVLRVLGLVDIPLRLR